MNKIDFKKLTYAVLITASLIISACFILYYVNFKKQIKLNQVFADTRSARNRVADINDYVLVAMQIEQQFLKTNKQLNTKSLAELNAKVQNSLARLNDLDFESTKTLKIDSLISIWSKNLELIIYDYNDADINLNIFKLIQDSNIEASNLLLKLSVYHRFLTKSIISLDEEVKYIVWLNTIGYIGLFIVSISVIIFIVFYLNQVQTNLIKLNQSLNEKNEELNRFASVTAHDLKEPLRMISNFTGLLEKRFKDQLDDKTIKYIGFITDGSKRMHSLINNLLDYARSGGTNLHPEQINLKAVLKNVTNDLQNKIALKQATLTIEDVYLEVNGIYSLLYSLFLNLIGNALKFSKEGVNPQIEIKHKVEKGFVIFSISDNGIGIDKEDIPKLFKTFSRLHQNEKIEGTGLGLATCKRIVEKHHGKIWIDPKTTEGTTIYFTLKIN